MINNYLFYLFFLIFFGTFGVLIKAICQKKLKFWLKFFLTFNLFCFYLLYLITLIIRFLITDHRLWYKLFTYSVDIEFYDMQSKQAFFNWLNWNLSHLELIICYTQFFRIAYIFFNFIFYYIWNKLNIYLKISLNFFFFICISPRNLWVFNFFFKLKLRIISLLNNSIIFSLWMFFLWLRTYLFIITRLDLNFIFWSIFVDNSVIYGQLRGFKLDFVNNEYILYLSSLRPLLFEKNILIKKIFFFWNQILYFFCINIFFFIYKLTCKLNISERNKLNTLFLFTDPNFTNLKKKIFFWLKYFWKKIFDQNFKFWNQIRIYFFNFLVKIFILLNYIYVSFFYICIWFFYLIYKIRFFIFFFIFIFFFGFFIFVDLFVWWIPLMKNIIFTSFIETHAMKHSVTFWKAYPYIIYPFVKKTKYFVGDIPPYLILNWRVFYHWHHFLDGYDYSLMSLKRLGEMTDDNGEPIESWQKYIVWRESFKWIPMARNAEVEFQLWSEGLKFRRFKHRFYNLYKVTQPDLFSWTRILKVKYYPYDTYCTFYKDYDLWKEWTTFFTKRMKWKKRWKKRTRPFVTFMIKFKLYIQTFITPERYKVWIWFNRVYFYFFLACFDKIICYRINYWIYNLYSYNIIYFFINFIISIVNPCISLFKYIYNNVYLLLYFLNSLNWNFILLQFQTFFNVYWNLLFFYSKLFISVEFNLFIIWNYLLYYFEIVFTNLIFLDNILKWYEMRPIWGNLLKSIFTFRDYLKTFLDIFYLEYDSLVHRRYTYIAYYIQNIKKLRYKNKKTKSYMRRGFLRRLGMARFLLVPNNIASTYFTKILGLAYDSKVYWKCRRSFLRVNWFYRCHKLFRSYEYLILGIWSWLILCLFFFKGFRYFFFWKLLPDFNGLFYWHKMRQQPAAVLSKLLSKIDRIALKEKLYGVLASLEFTKAVWMVDFNAEIFLTESENMKKYYQDSLELILNKTTFFDYRINTLKSDIIRNWDKLEFFFFSKITENYFETWMSHSEFLNVVIFELMLVTDNEDVWGLTLTALDDEDLLENTEAFPSIVDIVSNLMNNIFSFFYRIDKVLFNYKLPGWVWHKSYFINYFLRNIYNNQISTVSFESIILDSLGPIFLWSFFIPAFFLIVLKCLLRRNRGWKHRKWAPAFFKITFWYHFDLYAEGVNLLMRAFFNTQAFMLWRGKFSGKSFQVMRKRKLRWRRRFIWHYLKTCYLDFALIKVFINQKNWSFFERIRLQQTSLSYYIFWFTAFQWVSWGFILFCITTLYKYTKCNRQFFKKKLQIKINLKEFLLHWTHLNIYFNQKIMLRTLCKKK